MKLINKEVFFCGTDNYTMYIYDLFSAQELIPAAPAPQKVRIYNVLVYVVGQI